MLMCYISAIQQSIPNIFTELRESIVLVLFLKVFSVRRPSYVRIGVFLLHFRSLTSITLLKRHLSANQ